MESSIALFLDFFVSFWFGFVLVFFNTGFLCERVLAVLEVALVDQAGLELTDIHLPLPPECWE